MPTTTLLSSSSLVTPSLVLRITLLPNYSCCSIFDPVPTKHISPIFTFPNIVAQEFNIIVSYPIIVVSCRVVINLKLPIISCINLASGAIIFPNANEYSTIIKSNTRLWKTMS